MKVQETYEKLVAASHSIRTFITHPIGEGPFPGILLYTDLFQLSEPLLRACRRLAGHGFFVAAPEIFAKHLKFGTVLPFNDEGRERGFAATQKTSTEDFNSDLEMLTSFLIKHPLVSAKHLGCAGFCIGGHLAFRASLHKAIKATTCFYPTGLHNGKLGKDDPKTLQKLDTAHGSMLIFFGKDDPHVPENARKVIYDALQSYKVKATVYESQTEHAHMREDTPRYDAEATDFAWKTTIDFFRKHFGEPKDSSVSQSPILSME